MIEANDFIFADTGILRNKLGITDPSTLSKAVADSTAHRFAELQASPIRGGFDSAHLQAIHHHLYQDVFDWAGVLRPLDAGSVPASQLENSLDSVFDRLSRENHLKGLSADEWSRSASAYISNLETIRPFLAGNEITIREFATELARKNNLSLRWDTTPDIASDSMTLLSQVEQSANLRRLIMLAVDADPAQISSSRAHSIDHSHELHLTLRDIRI
jgi:cell filamentation protein